MKRSLIGISGFLFSLLICEAQVLRSADLSAVRMNEIEQRADGFFIPTGTDAYLVWSDLQTSLPAVAGVELHLEFDQPLNTRTFWEFYWGSGNEGFHRSSMVYFTAGRAGDTSLKLWLPIGSHPLFQHYPFGDLKELRLSTAHRFDRAFRVNALEVHRSDPGESLTSVSLYHFSTPDAYLRVDRSTRLANRILRDWAARWAEHWGFTAGFFLLLVFILVALSRLGCQGK